MALMENLKQIPKLTGGLIIISTLIAIVSNFGSSLEPLKPLFISQYFGQGLVEIWNGQVWRLFTPVLIHFGVLHLVFNMLWLWDLGGMIETRRGILELTALLLVIGVLSNIGQYLYAGPAFGGMSGVVYGLLGYVWMYSQFRPSSGLFLHKQTVIMMLVWYILCWTGLMGPIANMAHTAGLVIGVVWGFSEAKLRSL